ncbi:hypothetical protein LIER_09120 [Lithospermum erythrorhizon]|uniref:Uncharacterized protein n=1 Tax=Lithospermum erythrorhizon TaxID=34254 RepID=A0AAV3PEK6_LITER
MNRSSDDESSSNVDSSLSATVGNQVVSRITPTNDDVKASTPIKDQMFQCSENQMGDYELRPLDNSNHTECSRAGEMSLRPVVELTVQEPAPAATQIPIPCVARGSVQSSTPAAVERAETAYQGIMASLPTFFKKYSPSPITLDQLDGFSTYFSIPVDKVDTRLPLPGDQVILPRIEADSIDPDLTLGYTAVYVESFSYGIRLPFLPLIARVEPLVSLFSALFTVTHEDFQTTFRARRCRNILAEKRPNRVPDNRLFKKWFLARGGMAVGVPLGMKRNLSHFIKSTVKPRESMVPPDFAPAAPLHSSLVAVPPVRPMLKMIASEFPIATSKPSNKVKKAVPPKKPSQVLARNSEEAETHSQGVGS